MKRFQKKIIPQVLFGYFIFLFSLTKASDWSYSNVKLWGKKFPQCNGDRQSPINLDTSQASKENIPALKFQNYEDELRIPFKLVNNGHSIQYDIPETYSGTRPSISGSILSGEYVAKSLHFHWGSNDTAGAEHHINGKKYDLEMHIVHQKKGYSDEEALNKPDGLAVLGVMFELSKSSKNYGMKTIAYFARFTQEYKSEMRMRRNLMLADFLQGLDKSSFFTYNGSLTTPKCSEAVVWHVFDKPLAITQQELSAFLKVQTNEEGDLLQNNFRPLQKINNRKIVYRPGNN